jgi:hypothetical protein
LAVCVVSARAEDGDWTAVFFDHTSHDFGVVPRGAKLEHRFVVENFFDDDLEIQSVSTSCGCSRPQVSQRRLKTLEKAEISAGLDTHGALGQRDVIVKVVFAPPFGAEVQLHLRAFIRTDVVVEPGAVQFGVVTEGTAVEKSLTVDHIGGGDWRIERVECANPHITASIAETKRAPGIVSYSISAKLKEDAPRGYVRDQLVLVTNDPHARTSHVPITVDGLVVAALSTSSLWMGIAESGQPVTRNLVVHGRTPFHIVAVRSGDVRFQCNRPVEASRYHILPVTFLEKGTSATTRHVATNIRIETDLPGAQPIETSVSVQVVPGTTKKP